ncbi:MAG: diaminopimelate epimerase [Clostridia bacterium]|nr:diaminopimelate epimerase [Clostridia bacterium]
MRFTKMHGCGNDYVYVDCFHEKAPADPGRVAVDISRPHTGVGADGLILIEPCEGADAFMRIFNKDGSEGEMCGNGIRCVGKYLYDSGIARKSVLQINTRGGLKTLQMQVLDGVAVGARVDMGLMRFESAYIPVRAPGNRVTLSACGHTMTFFCVNAGNPHAVTFDYFPTDDEFARMGSMLENDPVFPERANISFTKLIDQDTIQARIWERGSGPTQACGSGATATQTAAYKLGLTGPRATVRLPGGELIIEYDAASGHAFMSGPAHTVFTGNYPI